MGAEEQQPQQQQQQQQQQHEQKEQDIHNLRGERLEPTSGSINSSPTTAATDVADVEAAETCFNDANAIDGDNSNNPNNNSNNNTNSSSNNNNTNNSNSNSNSAAPKNLSREFSEANLSEVQVPKEVDEVTRQDYQRNGYVVIEGVIPPRLCDALADRLDWLLRGEFDTGVSPDKVPRESTVPADYLAEGQGTSPTSAASAKPAPRVDQFVNAWKGDRLFESVIHSEALASWVASVVGWPNGAEVLQDQIWSKPPGSGPIAYHRDTAYMGDGVVTLWLSLDDLDSTLGPLEYARGSHLWKPPPFKGYAPSLFGKKDWRAELSKAAIFHGLKLKQVNFQEVLVGRGGGSLHNGRLWHGSNINRSTRFRRGLGIHFGPIGNRPTPPTELARRMEGQTEAGFRNSGSSPKGASSSRTSEEFDRPRARASNKEDDDDDDDVRQRAELN